MRLKSSHYIPIRDDGSSDVLFSKNERELVHQALIQSELRMDGRSPTQLRPARIQLTRSAMDGTTGCTVQWGNAITVHCHCSAQIVPPPTSDRPNEGSVQIAVDLSPMASTSFKYGQAVTNGGIAGGRGKIGGPPMDESQKLVANRILRCLENLMNQCLDTEALVIVPGQWVWQLQLRITVWDCGAHNLLLDACVLATMAALRHYRQPATTAPLESSNKQYNQSNATTALPQTQSLDLKEGTPLPLHHTPLSITFAWLARNDSASSAMDNHLMVDDEDDDLSADRFLVLADPSWQEQRVVNGNELSLQVNIHGEICGLVSSGAVVTNGLLRQCHKLALELIPQLSQSLENTLHQANQQALQEGLERLKKQQGPAVGDATMDGDGKSSSTTEHDRNNEMVLQAAEEKYRKQALEYNLGHQAVKIREDDADQKTTTKQGASASSSRLLQSLLHAASQQAKEDEELQRQAEKARSFAATNSEDKLVVPTPTTAPLDTTGVEVLPMSKPPPSSSNPHKEAMLRLPIASSSTADGNKSTSQFDDSDAEENTTMQLHSEFTAASTVTAGSPQKMKTDSPDNEDLGDDERMEDIAEDDYDAIKAYNKDRRAMEEEEEFWEANRNTNHPSADSGGEKAPVNYRGADKLKGGRIPNPSKTKTAEGEKPTAAESRRKARNMAKRRDQQKKAMSKRNG